MATNKKNIGTINDLLKELIQKGGSDLHLKVGAPPIMRKQSKLCALDNNYNIIDFEGIDKLLKLILKEDHLEKLRTNGAVDLGYGIADVGRFRFNVFFQRGSIRAVIRHVPHKVPAFKDLNLPQEMLNIINCSSRGLVLVAGATGSGKSTTLAALINHINYTQNKHIITVEDPIEFLIQDHYSLITQRELGVDCFDPVLSFKAALRQDPDIILFSELRLKDIISVALTAAETGHLVLSTIHAQSTTDVISRILSAFSSTEIASTRLVLSQCLRAVFGQRLIPKKDKSGLVPAVEILINNNRMQREIEIGSSKDKLQNIISQSQSHWGMQTFDQHIITLAKQGIISEASALRFANSPEKIKLATAGVVVGSSFQDTQIKAKIRKKMKKESYKEHTNVLETKLGTQITDNIVAKKETA